MAEAAHITSDQKAETRRSQRKTELSKARSLKGSMPLRAVPLVDLVSQTLGGYERISDSTHNIAECREEEHFRRAARA